MNPLLLTLPFLSILFATVAVALKTTFPSNPEIHIVSYFLSGSTLIAWILLDRQAFISAFKRKGSKQGFSQGLSLILVTAILAGAGMLSTKPRFNKSVDLTTNSNNTLSNQSQKIVEKIEKSNTAINIIGFFKDEAMKMKFTDLLKLYQTQGFNPQIQYIDPQQDPTKAIAEKITYENTVIVKAGKRSARFSTISEEKFTNAIIHAMKANSKTIYFTTGHGEGKIDNKSELGYEIAVSELTGNRYNVKPLNLLKLGKVPSDADLIIIANPNYDFKDSEVKMIERSMLKGTPLLTMADSMKKIPNLNRLLADFGLEFSSDLLILDPNDPRAQLLGQNYTFVSKFDDLNPVTKDFAAQSSVNLGLTNTRSLRTIEKNRYSMNPQLIAHTADIIIKVKNIKTSKDLESISNSQVESGEFPVIGVSTGPLGSKELAQKALSNQATSADVAPKIDSSASKELKIAAVGSGSLATNQGVQSAENLDMFINLTNYLLEDEDFISIRPKDIKQSNLDIASDSSQFWFIFISFIYPFIFIGAGTWYWLRRRSA